MFSNGNHLSKGLGNVGTGWNISGTGNFTGDSNDDILWRSSNGDVVTWDNIDLKIDFGALDPATHEGVSFGNVGMAWHIVGNVVHHQYDIV